MYLSKHFTKDEFCHSATAERKSIPNMPDLEQLCAMTALCENLLEPIRGKFGAVIVTSGFRGKELNEVIGGSNNSQHSKGEAVDFHVLTATTKDVCEYIRTSGLSFDQLIWEGSWVHLSYTEYKTNRGDVLTAHFHKGRNTTYTVGIDA